VAAPRLEDLFVNCMLRCAISLTVLSEHLWNMAEYALLGNHLSSGVLDFADPKLHSVFS